MKKLIIALLIFTGISQVASSQVEKMQAMFIYNFSRLVKWPPETSKGDFIIGILGNSPMVNTLKEYTASKRVGQQLITVKQFNSPKDISSCHILFVTENKSSSMQDIINSINDMNSLVVSEKAGLINAGAAIDFLIVDNKLKFQINIDNAQKRDLVISKALQDMAYMN